MWATLWWDDPKSNQDSKSYFHLQETWKLSNHMEAHSHTQNVKSSEGNWPSFCNNLTARNLKMKWGLLQTIKWFEKCKTEKNVWTLLGPTANKETIKRHFWENHENLIMDQVLDSTIIIKNYYY